MKGAVYFSDIIKCLIGKPSEEQYQACLKHLEKQVEEFEPRAIVAFGKETARTMLPYLAEMEYEATWWSVSKYNEVPALISPHPLRIKLLGEGKGYAFHNIERFLSCFAVK